MLKGDDKQLYDYTMKMMENITSHYLKTDFDKGTDVNKLIEHGVARKIAAIMPDKYTEVEVTVAEVNKNLYVTATYSIDGETEIVAIHKEGFADAYTDEDFFLGYKKAEQKNDAGTARDKLDALLNKKVSLGVSCCGTDSKALKAKNYPQYDENGNYDPRCMTEVFTSTWGHHKEGRGSKVETLPSGQGLGSVDEDMSYFRSKLMKGLKRTINPPYTKERFEVAENAERAETKPTVDFKQISQLAPTSNEIPRYESGMHVGIDLAMVDVEEQITAAMSKEILVEIDKQIMNDITTTAKGMTSTATEKGIGAWAVPTFGWTEEKTDWKTKSDITYTADRYTSDVFFNGTSTLNNPFGVITSNNTAPVWYNPNGTLMEEISFTDEELDELIDLIHNGESKVMEFV